MGVVAINREPGKLVDLAAIDASQLVLLYQAEQSRYDTAAFDPEGKFMRFYPGGFSIWSGFPGAGKTTLIRQTICQLLAADRSVFLASLEEDYRGVLMRLAATAAGVPEASSRHLEAFLHRSTGLLHLWEEEGNASVRRIMERIELLAAGDGVNHAFIDSLMCLDVANDDYDAQRIVANGLARLGRKMRCHVHLVAHPRKLVSADQEPDLNDVAGAREIGGLADNVLFVRRSRKRDEYKPHSHETPMGVSIRKQRHFDGGLGDVEGWFHRDQRQFHVGQFDKPTRYLPEWAFT